MASVDVSVFRPHIRLMADNAPDSLCDLVAWRALNEFFQSTELWKVSLAKPLDFVVGLTSYDPTSVLPTGTNAARICKLRWRPTGEDIRFLTRDQLDESFPGWELEDDLAPEYYTNLTHGTVRLYPFAAGLVPAAIEMTVAVTISTPTSQFPAEFFTSYIEDVLPGMYAKLQEMPNKKWSSPRDALANSAKFMAAIAKGKSKAEADFGRPEYQTSYGGIGGSGSAYGIGSSYGSGAGRLGGY
jgi:hypothetical protein